MVSPPQPATTRITPPRPMLLRRAFRRRRSSSSPLPSPEARSERRRAMRVPSSLFVVALCLATAAAGASSWRTADASPSAAAPSSVHLFRRSSPATAAAEAPTSPLAFARGTKLSYAGRKLLRLSSSVRGGAAALDDDEDEDESDYGWSDSDEESDNYAADESSEGSEEEGDESEDEEDEEDSDEEESPSPSGPVKLVISTGLSCPLVDQTMEVTASRQRDVASVRNTVSRQMRGRPPAASVRLLLGTRELMDDEIVGDLVLDDEDEEEEEEDGDEEGDEDDDDDEGMVKLKLTLDAVPPVDPKFGTELPERIRSMSTSEILEAYAANVAAAHANAVAMVEDDNARAPSDDDRDEEMDGEEPRPAISAPSLPASVAMRRHALSVKERMVSALPEEALKVLEAGPPGSETEDELGEGDIALKESLKRRSGRRKMKGGASTHVKRVLQRNMNVNWPDTIRNSVLFLFFGYFGGRDSTSRALLYLGAPLCFVLQARPVKIAAKRLFYAAGNPPGIFLSLLPAPQQAIMSLDYEGAVMDLYGSGAAGGRALGSQGEGEDDNEDVTPGDYDDDDNDTEYDDEDSEGLETSSGDFDDEEEYDDDDY